MFSAIPAGQLPIVKNAMEMRIDTHCLAWREGFFVQGVNGDGSTDQKGTL